MAGKLFLDAVRVQVPNLVDISRTERETNERKNIFLHRFFPFAASRKLFFDKKAKTFPPINPGRKIPLIKRKIKTLIEGPTGGRKGGDGNSEVHKEEATESIGFRILLPGNFSTHGIPQNCSQDVVGISSFRWRLEWDERLKSMNTQWEDSRNIIEWSAKWIEMDRAICRHASRRCLAYRNILTLLKVSLMPSGASKSSSLITWLVFRLMPIRWIKTNEPWMEESIKYRVTIEHELRWYVVDADTFAQRYAINITRWTQPQRLWLKNDVHRDVKPQTERNRDEFGCGEFLAEYFQNHQWKAFSEYLKNFYVLRTVSRAGWTTIRNMNHRRRGYSNF